MFFCMIPLFIHLIKSYLMSKQAFLVFLALVCLFACCTENQEQSTKNANSLNADRISVGTLSTIAEPANPKTPCDSISDSLERDNCIYNMAKENMYRTKNISLCALFNNTLKQRDCIRSFAVALEDPSLCYLSNDSSEWTNCVYAVVDYSFYKDFCVSIDDLSQRYDCMIIRASRFDNASICLSITDSTKRDLCFDPIARKHRNTSLCSLASDSLVRDSCIYYIALGLYNSSQCALISNLSMRDECLFYTGPISGHAPANGSDCSIQNALNKEDPAECNCLANDHYLRDRCLYTLGIALVDEDTCYNVSYKEDYVRFAERGDCLITVDKSNFSACLNISRPEPRTKCIRTKADESGNLSFCNFITEPSGREDCISGIAISKGNESPCFSLNQSKYLEECFHRIAEYSRPVVCIYLNGSPADDCYLDAAFFRSDKSLCGPIRNESLNAYCYSRLGGKGDGHINQSEQMLFCNSVKNGSDRLNCIAYLVLATGNHSLCNLAGLYEQIHACQNRLAYVSGDPSYCSGGPVALWYDRCITNMAQIKKDPSLCLKIQPESTGYPRSACLMDYAHNAQNLSVCGMLEKEADRESCKKSASTG